MSQHAAFSEQTQRSRDGTEHSPFDYEKSVLFLVHILTPYLDRRLLLDLPAAVLREGMQHLCQGRQKPSLSPFLQEERVDHIRWGAGSEDWQQVQVAKELHCPFNLEDNLEFLPAPG